MDRLERCMIFMEMNLSRIFPHAAVLRPGVDTEELSVQFRLQQHRIHTTAHAASSGEQPGVTS